MSGLQYLMDHSPFCVACKVEAEGEAVEVECPSYPEHCGGPEKEECMVAQHEMWKNTVAQL